MHKYLLLTFFIVDRTIFSTVIALLARDSLLCCPRDVHTLDFILEKLVPDVYGCKVVMDNSVSKKAGSHDFIAGSGFDSSSSNVKVPRTKRYIK